ncbi:MAG TPA: CBS domain-containing protein [Chryseosolibacter sp.]|nr:CBS domain-containing protein [Chryseosolibacter sp.]
MKKVSEVLAHKGRSIISATPEAKVFEALKLMSDKNIGSVLVMEGPTYVGLLTERDYARKVILKGKASSDVRVKDIMSTGLPEINPETSIDDCMKLMSDNNLRYLPVFEGGVVIGIISINDVIKAVIANHEDTIQQLENYIHS